MLRITSVRRITFIHNLSLHTFSISMDCYILRTLFLLLNHPVESATTGSSSEW
ncbi:hypothetical protein CXB51_032032 [Gossypium anomalum]|uniref:Uncharacterized protein n=1 Tax=Gossypium anomalum TaxID=47600 RepID=A0A8J5YC62_9ROSI|nr:hypothetical protein CXB51_032032 [Gossypium anomalum]